MAMRVATHLRGTLPGRCALGVAAGLAAMLGCAAPPAHPWAPPKRPLVWPLPPDPPRIRYEGAITAGQAFRFATRTGWRVFDWLAGARRVELSTPHGLCVGRGLLAFTDSGRPAVHVVHLAERRYKVIEAVGDTRLRCPIGLAIAEDGALFVSDSALARVFCLSADGRPLGEVEAKFVRPSGVAYDAARRRLHVVDSGAHVVSTFERAAEGWRLVHTLGGRGEEAGTFNFPTHAAVDRAGTLWVTDSLNHRIQFFDAEGKRLGAFGQAGDGTGDFAKAKGIALDSEGHVYVVDSLYDVVQVFDRQGRFLLAFGGSGKEEGLLWLPTGLCTDDEDRIYVSDTGNSRIQVFQYLRAEPAQGPQAP